MKKISKRSEPLYNVVILRNWVAYLRSNLGWNNKQIESIFEKCGIHISFLDYDDNWFSQEIADKFNEIVTEESGDPSIAEKVGVFALNEAVRGIAGHIVSSLLSPRRIFKNIESVSGYYTKATKLTAISVQRGQAVIKSELLGNVEEKPYQCLNRMGMLKAAPTLFNATNIKVEHPICIHKSDRYCQYDITWTTAKKHKALPISLLVSAVGFALFGSFLSIQTGAFIALVLGLLTFLGFRELVMTDLYKAMESQNTSLSESLQVLNRRHEESTILRKVVDSTAEMMPISELCSTVVQSIREKMKFDRAIILLVDGDKLTTRATAGYEEKYAKLLKNTEFNIDPNNLTGYFIRTVNTKQPLLARDVQSNLEQLSGRSKELAAKLKTDSFIVAPILFHENVLGVVGVENEKQSTPLTQNDLELVSSLASNIGVAIANARSFAETKTALDKNEKLRVLFQKYVPSEMRVEESYEIDDMLKLRRKTLGIMFIDVMGFTAMSERETPETVAKVLNVYIDEVQKRVEYHRGRINKIMGDGMLIYFDPKESNTVEAGISILEGISEINNRLEKVSLPPVSLGIGAHLGTCTLGNIGSVNRLDYTIIGDAVNIASRIESYTRETGPNTFCFSRELLPEAATLEVAPRGQIKLKGHPKPIEIFQYLSRREVQKIA